MKISALVVTFNEEKRLKECLQSIAFCDQVVVVDLGSTDYSIKIAQKYATEVILHELVSFAEETWPDIFPTLKYEWVLRADPDEIFPEELIEEIGELILLEIKSKVGVELGTNVSFIGKPWITLENGSEIHISSNCTIVSDFHHTLAGINHPCILSTIKPGSIICVGSGSGMSGVTIVAAEKVEIGDNVGIGVNSYIYDTDFHSIDFYLRRINNPLDVNMAPIIIGNDVWTGANVLILKGVTIGDNSIIGAVSVVTHDVDANCLYADNPAKLIKKI